MRGDEQRRERERSLGSEAGEPDEWLAQAREAQRRGDPPGALQAALAGLRHHPHDAALRALLPSLDFAGAWPESDGNAQRQRASPFVGPRAGVQRWRAELPGRPTGEPVVDARGNAWIRCEQATLAQVDASGSTRGSLSGWPTDLPALLVEGAPRCFDPLMSELGTPPGAPCTRDAQGKLYVVEGARIVALDAGGLRRWQAVYLEGVGTRRTLTLGPHLLAVASAWPLGTSGPGKTSVRWLDTDSGALRHEEVAPYGSVRAVAAPGERWLVAHDHRLRCLRPPDVLWERALRDVQAPALCGSRVLTSSLSGAHALDLESGEVAWHTRGLRAGYAPLVDAAGVSYFVVGGALLALDAAGEPLLRVPLGGLGPLGPPVIAAPGVLYLSAGQTLVAIA